MAKAGGSVPSGGEATDQPAASPQRPLRSALRLFTEVINLHAFSLLQLATALPKRWALAVANGLGLIAAASPLGMRVTNRMRAMFPSRAAFALARQRLTLPFHDHVIAVRIATKRELPTQWLVESRNTPAILNEPERSFIVATGHFSRDPMASVYSPSVVPKKMTAVVAPLDRHAMNPRALRLRIQLGQMVKGISQLRDGDADVVEVGGPGVVAHLLANLKQPDSYVVIATDAPWPEGRKGGYKRAFAGRAIQNFALGSARLSRLAQCPIIPCVPFVDGDRVVLEWGEPIEPAPISDQDADLRVTDTILDMMEHAIGLRPEQYVLGIGHQRRWDAEAGRWIALPRAASQPHDDPNAHESHAIPAE
jgi:lauroyl/myristoyl acyltransferase